MTQFNIRSMTGFGRVQQATSLGTFTVEIRSVNSRYREISVSLPRPLSALEHPIRKKIKGRIERGKIECRVQFDAADGEQNAYHVNIQVVREYLDHLKQIEKESVVKGNVDLVALLHLPGVIDQPNDALDVEAHQAKIEPIIGLALDAFDAERLREGEALGEHLMKELDLLRSLRSAVEKDQQQVVDRYREKLMARIVELEEEVRAKLEPGRLEIEVALYADKCDVREEVVRLQAHFERFETLIRNKKGKAVGKELNFLFQEIQRETNTVSSKSHDLDIADSTLQMKAAIERAREQIQNLE